MNRRTFLSLSSATALGAYLSACTDQHPSGRYTHGDIELLASQRAEEAARSGRGQFGVHRYQGYRGLAKLPWFELDQNGQLICVDESIPKSIDVHSHLGISSLFARTLDLNEATPRVKHILDCDGQEPGCELDLDVYINGNFTDDNLSALKRSTISQGFWRTSTSVTHTIPNLIREMDSMRVEKSVLLPIKLGLPFGDSLTEHWRTSVRDSGHKHRFVEGFSLHPRGNDRLEKIEQYARQGHRVLKLHPTVQRFFPDDESMTEVYQLAQELGLIIFFHGGRAGIEPESSHPFAMPRHYEKAFKDFPKLQFVVGHAGARDAEGMLEVARSYKNVWLGTHGQSLSNLDKMIDVTQGERMLFGTDWPFYHIGASLAKVLIVTQAQDRKKIRAQILRENALDLLIGNA